MGRKFEIIYLETIDIVFSCFCKAFFDTRTLRSLRLFEITKGSKREHVSIDFPKKDIKDCRGRISPFFWVLTHINKKEFRACLCSKSHVVWEHWTQGFKKTSKLNSYFRKIYVDLHCVPINIIITWNCHYVSLMMNDLEFETYFLIRLEL